MPGSGNAGGSSNNIPATQGTEYSQELLSNAGEAYEIEDIGDNSSSIIIRAHEQNEGKIYIGWDENVNDSNGFYLKPDDIITIDMDIDSQSIFMYPVNSNEVIMYLAIE